MYRFRSIENLLGKYNELENQEIYFASPEELNDPMEGLRDVYWQGDEIVWKNLIINYTKSLQKVCPLTLILDDNTLITNNDVPVARELLHFYSPMEKEIFEVIIDKLFSNTFINELPLNLSKRIKPIRRSELLSYFQIIHPFVINSISDVYYAKQLITKPLFTQDLNAFEKAVQLPGGLPELTNKLEEENEKLSDSFFNFFNNYTQSKVLSSQVSYSDKRIRSNVFFLMSEFPNTFISKLENEIYPPWYSASFLSENKNSAIWGHYGDNHRGVCLKYRTIQKDGDLILNLETEYGYSSGPMIGMKPHTFKEIKYHNKHVEIDFFRSMGRLNRLELKQLWYSNKNGDLSICGSHLNSPEKEDEWRAMYWDNFNKSLVIKLKEWEYENEYRLIVHGDFVDYSKKESRKLKYDFKDLESITFGIKTPNSSKLKIIKIIQQKCKENKRDDFEFFQAYYSKASGKIESFKLNL